MLSFLPPESAFPTRASVSARDRQTPRVIAQWYVYVPPTLTLLASHTSNPHYTIVFLLTGWSL
jgi:hypothetical protein